MLKWAWSNECAGWMAIGRAPEGQGVVEVEEVAPGLSVCWWRGEPGGLDNYVHVAPDCSCDPNDMLDELEPAVQDSTQPTNLRMAEAELDTWLAPALQRGYTPVGSVPAMVCDLNQRSSAVRPDSQISVKAVGSAAEYRAAFDVSHAVYQGPTSLTAFFNPYGTTQMYLASWNGEPAASATLWPFAGVAGIYSVAVLPQFRRRGLARAVVNFALDDAVRRGFTVASLRTADDLMPLYEGCGFRYVGRIHSLRREK